MIRPKLIKNKRQVKDPARYPRIIIPIENESREVFRTHLKNFVEKFTKEMVKIVKEK